MSKRTICIFTVICMLLGIPVMPVYAVTSGPCGNDLGWYLDGNGKLTIEGQGAMTDWSAAADVPWYSSRDLIQEVVIGSGAESVGNNAFRDCLNLKSVTLSGNIVTIGRNAFHGCASIESIELPTNLTTIERYAFYGCGSLESITFSGKLRTVEDCAFYNCTGLKSITVPERVTSIGEFAFRDCTGLKSITLSKSITSIAKGLFYGCTNLTHITIPNSVTVIDTYAFYNCTGLTRISIPKSVSSVGDLAFAGCSGIETVFFSGTESEWNDISPGIGNDDLTNAEIVYNSESASGSCGDNLEWTFDGGTLTVTGQGDMTDWSFDGNEMWYSDMNVPWLSVRSSIAEVIIENGVTSIGNNAFSRCSGLESIAIPNSVTSIGNRAFNSCSGLESITIPNSVTSIGHSAFSGCTLLKTINIPDGVTSIGETTFCECENLTSITLPGNVTSIGNSAFSDCILLKSINIPDGVTSIGKKAFYDSGIISITLPDSVTSIGDSAFSECHGIRSITLPNTLTTISDNMFYYCSRLESITIPATVTSIGDSTFLSCNNIKAVFFTGTESEWNEISIGSGNSDLTGAVILYAPIEKTYKFETNCGAVLSDVTGYAVITEPAVQNDGMTFLGWYDNEVLSGKPVTFPYYGDKTTLYALWTDRTGADFDNAFIVNENHEFTATTTGFGQIVYFEFVPKRSKYYRFYTTGDFDTFGYLYDSNKTQLASDDDKGTGENFRIIHNLTAGETYYIAAKLNSNTGNFTFVAEEPFDYQINRISLKNMSGNSLNAIPAENFRATVSLSNLGSVNEDIIILAAYTADNILNGFYYLPIENLSVGSTKGFTFDVDNTNGNIEELKVFCWESFDTLSPMCDPVSFTAK